MTPSITENDFLAVLRAFLLQVLPAGTEVIKSQVNVVPEPTSPNFVLMTPLARDRLAWNVDGSIDAVGAGSIAGATMTVSAMTFGRIIIGSPVFGVGVAANTVVTALGTGHGGVGTYTVAPTQTISSEKLAFGTTDVLTSTNAKVQLDFHGDASSDNCQTFFGLFRDAYACDFFTAAGYDMQPLYATDPVQAPFINGENQYENRWTCNALIQINPVISTPQQFADTVTVELVEVDERYPP